MTAEQISRRSFLILGSSAVLFAVTACAPERRSSPSASPTPTATARPTVQDLIAAAVFFVAHRGSGDNWPEHTLTAYTNALQAGAEAVEISVCATSDGVLVCHHDLSAKRVLGIDAKIADLTWAEVEDARVDARVWLGVDTPLEPVARLEDVLAALDPATLVFIEDKQGTNTKALLDLLDAQPRAQERFVWKQWAPAQQVSAAKERGYAAWGYFDEAEIDRVAEFAETFDILGVPVGMRDESIATVVAAGRPVMAWEVRFHDDVARLTKLGVSGMMCANIPYLRRDRAEVEDSFASGRRAPGDLPSGLEKLGWSAQPAFVPDRAAVRIQRAGDAAYLLGSLAAPGTSLSEFSATLRLPDALPEPGSTGYAFALTGDAQGGDGERGEASGYELHLHSDGRVRLLERVDGVGGAVLAEHEGAALQAGEPVVLAVSMTDDEIVVSRDGDTILSTKGPRWRGPFVRIFKSYEAATAVEFTSVSSSLV